MRHHIATGEILYQSGSAGAAWRVLAGSIRLDRPTPEGDAAFASLAIRGDVIGAETMLFGVYSFTATALAPCTLMSWPAGEGAPVPASDLLQTLIVTECRAAEVIALRCGQAAERVRRLVMLLAAPGADGGGSARDTLQVTLPPRQDMADITALTLETVSRMVSGLRRSGVLKPLTETGSVSGNRFRLAGSIGESP